MSFGWSAGDIVAALKLLYTIGSALKDSGGASSELQDILSFLQTLPRTLEHLYALQATPFDPDLAKNLLEQCDQIRIPLDAFLGDVGRRFDPALGLNCRRNRIFCRATQDTMGAFDFKKDQETTGSNSCTYGSRWSDAQSTDCASLLWNLS
jgi:hypothetical protein